MPVLASIICNCASDHDLIIPLLSRLLIYKAKKYINYLLTNTKQMIECNLAIRMIDYQLAICYYTTI